MQRIKTFIRTFKKILFCFSSLVKKENIVIIKLSGKNINALLIKLYFNVDTVSNLKEMLK